MNYSHLPILFLILTSMAIPILRYTSLLFSPITNNSIRFLSGGVFLLIIALCRYRSKLPSLFPKQKYIWSLLICCSFLMSINMVYFIKGLSLSSAFTGSMFTTFGIPVTTLFAMLFFPDERKKSYNIFFFIGMIICIIGSMIFINQNNNNIHSNSNNQFTSGTLFLSISICSQIILNNLIKYLSTQVPIIIIALCNSFGVGISLLILATITGDIQELSSVGIDKIIILIFAGVYGIFVGMLIGFSVIKQNGITTFNIIQLLTPITTAIFSYFIMKENISFTQFLGSSIILLGAYFCVFGKHTFNILLNKYNNKNLG
ncbi:MAG: DMT family transporter [Spirochaetota bacterium]|nr:DMT family transporter [Spirochaetota bacterium]